MERDSTEKVVLLLLSAIFIATSFLLLGFYFSDEEPKKISLVEAASDIQVDPIMDEVDGMSLEEKVGQMFIGGYHKANRLEEQMGLIQNQHFGGIILMRENVANSSQTSETIQRIKNVEGNLKHPLIIAIDEEGGVVSRLYRQLPQQTPQTRITSTDQAYSIGKEKGAQLNSLGINMNFAPVMDHINNPHSFLYDRVFHSSQEGIADLSSEMIRGYANTSVIAVPKHFPGHPDTTSNSHYKLPSSNVDRSQFDQYCDQFRKLISNSDPQIIMTGHVMFPQIDGEYPSTLSKTIITDILRNEYGFDGVVVTDDMNMGALKNNFEFTESAVLAVEAGNDILIYITEPKYQQAAYESVVNAVRSGRISEERIDLSAYRILKMKEGL